MVERTLEAHQRTDLGKNQVRRLRQRGLIPAVFYGKGQQPTLLAVDPKAVHQVLHSETGQNTIFSLKVDGTSQANVLIRDYQLDPVKGTLLHVDFLHVAMDVKLKVTVPIEVAGTPQGVKLYGGVLDVVSKEIEVECLPSDIPDHIKVEVSNLNIGDVIRLGDLPVDDKIRFLGDKDTVIATVVAPRVEEEEAKPVEAAEGAAEPEVIKKGKVAEEEGEPAKGEPKKEGAEKEKEKK